MSTSCKVAVSACPRWSDPVTFGGGRTIEKGGRVRSCSSPWKKPRSLQNGYQRASTSRCSYPFARSLRFSSFMAGFCKVALRESEGCRPEAIGRGIRNVGWFGRRTEALRRELALALLYEPIEVLADDGLGELRDHLPHDLLDDFERRLRERLAQERLAAVARSGRGGRLGLVAADLLGRRDEGVHRRELGLGLGLLGQLDGRSRRGLGGIGVD